MGTGKLMGQPDKMLGSNLRRTSMPSTWSRTLLVTWYKIQSYGRGMSQLGLNLKDLPCYVMLLYISPANVEAIVNVILVRYTFRKNSALPSRQFVKTKTFSSYSPIILAVNKASVSPAWFEALHV